MLRSFRRLARTWIPSTQVTATPATARKQTRRRPWLEELESRLAPSSTRFGETLFHAETPGTQLYLQRNGEAFIVPQSADSTALTGRAIRLDFVGANANIKAVGLKPGDGVGDFVTANGRAFDRVKFRNVYDGISVVYRQTPENHFEFVFLLRPGADPADITLAYRGAKRLHLDPHGNLRIRLQGSRLVEKAPFAFQRTASGSEEVTVRPWLDKRGRLGFRVDSYDSNRLLVIDPEINNPPEANDDFYETTHDLPLSVDEFSGVLSNDWDPDGDPLTAVLFSGPSHGDLTLNPDGSFQYDPDLGYAGQDAFTYRAFDGNAYSAVTTVTISVINSPPEANDDFYETTHDLPLSVDVFNGVLSNDWDMDGDTIDAILVSGPASGDLTLNPDGSFDYQPDPAWAGTDSFTYKAFDGIAYSAIATVNINVMNDPPFADDDWYEVPRDQFLSVDAISGVLSNDFDMDGDPLFAELVSGPTNGFLTLNPDGSFNYTPEPGFIGVDSFTYVAVDGIGYSNTATVSIDVIDQPPPGGTHITVSDVQVDEGNTGTKTAVFWVSLSQPEAATVTVDYATADGTALIEDEDYLSASGTLIFDPGIVSQPVSVTVVGDIWIEDDEFFTLYLSNATGYATIVDGVGKGTILDDEPFVTLVPATRTRLKPALTPGNSS